VLLQVNEQVEKGVSICTKCRFPITFTANATTDHDATAGEKMKRRIEDKLLIAMAWKFMPLSILRFQSGELFVYT
jgi:hypothetical protein